MKTPRKHKGAETELKAVVWLLEQGYEVFRNVSQHGYADLVAILDGNVTLIDVSTQLKARNEQQEEHNVRILSLNEDGNFYISDGREKKRYQMRSCPICDQFYTPTNEWQKYCSDKCKQKRYWTARKVG